MSKIAFIGLGNMGTPMALNLLQAGHEVYGYDTSPDALTPLAKAGAINAASARAAAAEAEVIITMLPNGAVVREVYEGTHGILAHLPQRPLLIDCSTISPGDARAIAVAANACSLNMLDAPVSGGVRGAREGTLSFMVGGDKAAFEQAKPFLAAMGRSFFHVGASGTGQAAKICNNMMAGILMAASAEVLALGARNGLAADVLSEIMRQSSGNNFMVDRWNPWPGVDPSAPASQEYGGGFQVNLLLKDLGLALESAQTSRSAIPLGAAARNLFQLHALQEAQVGTLDMSSIQRLYYPEQSH